MKVKMGYFKCMDSMARDMRHPYIPSTTVLGDSILGASTGTTATSTAAPALPLLVSGTPRVTVTTSSTVATPVVTAGGNCIYYILGLGSVKDVTNVDIN